jgi:tetratricopeptide (TPR) repeat protein
LFGRRLLRWRTVLEESRKLAANVLIIVLMIAVIPVVAAAIIKPALKPRYVIDAITVPKELVERGYTGEVMAQRILDEIQEIDRIAKTADIALLSVFSTSAFERSVPKIDVPVAGISLAAILSPVRELFGITDTKVTGEFIVDGEPTASDQRWRKPPTKYAFRLRIIDRGAVYRGSEPTENLDMLLENAARHVVRRFEPRVAIAYYIQNGDYKSARQMVDEALASGSKVDRESLLLMRGAIARAEKRYSDAIADYEELISRLPDESAPRYNLAHVYGELRRYSEALETALAGAKVATIPRERSKAYADAGSFALVLGKYDEALGYLELGRNADPTLGSVYFKLAAVYRDREKPDTDKAIAMFRLAAIYDPSNPSIYAEWGRVLAEQAQQMRGEAAAEKNRDSQEKLQRAIESADPNDYQVRRNVGETYEKLNLPVKAIEVYRAAIAIDKEVNEDLRAKIERLDRLVAPH